MSMSLVVVAKLRLCVSPKPHSIRPEALSLATVVATKRPQTLGPPDKACHPAGGILAEGWQNHEGFRAEMVPPISVLRCPSSGDRCARRGNDVLQWLNVFIHDGEASVCASPHLSDAEVETQDINCV